MKKRHSHGNHFKFVVATILGVALLAVIAVRQLRSQGDNADAPIIDEGQAQVGAGRAQAAPTAASDADAASSPDVAASAANETPEQRELRRQAIEAEADDHAALAQIAPEALDEAEPEPIPAEIETPEAAARDSAVWSNWASESDHG